MKIGNIELKWLGHAGFFIETQKGKIIYIDPYNIKDGLPLADMVFITHSHSDHCSLADLRKIAKEGTTIVAPADCQSTITKLDIPVNIELIEPEQEIELGEIKVSAIPSYNIDESVVEECPDAAFRKNFKTAFRQEDRNKRTR